MARLLSSGFETGDAAFGAEGQGAQAFNGYTLVQAASGKTRLSSRWAYTPSMTAGDYANWQASGAATANGTDYYDQCCIWFSANPTTSFVFMQRRSTSAGNLPYSIQLNTAGTISVIDNTFGTIFTSATALSLSTYHVIEVHWKIASASPGANMVLELRIDGTIVFSTTTANGGTTAPNQIRDGNVNGTATGISAGGFAIDDIAVNNNSGATDNSWPNGTSFVLLKPTADFAAPTGFTVGGGGTTNLWNAVDNQMPAGLADASATATSQIRSINKNITDNYEATLETYASVLPASATIKAVEAVASFGSSAASAMSLGLQVTTNPVVAEATLASAATAVAAYSTTPGSWTGWRATRSVPGTQPTFGTAPRIKVRKNTSAATAIDIQFIGLHVEYSISTAKSLVTPGRTVRNMLVRR